MIRSIGRRHVLSAAALPFLIALLVAPSAPARTAAPAATSMSWCGGAPIAQDRKPDLELSSQQQVHVLYVVPADQPDRFAEFASRIVTDVAAIDEWWQLEDAARRPRWDLFDFPGCTTRAGRLDLRSVRLGRNAGDYANSDKIDSLISDLAPVVGPVEKALVYYDGARTDDAVCGTSVISPLYAGRYAYAFVWLRSGCNRDLGTGGVAAATAAHELLHDLGAVPLAGPPHGCQVGGLTGHVCDDLSDVMFPFETGRPLAQTRLDIGRDDYYAHSGNWWDVQDSAWLSRLPQRRLSVEVRGPGRVTPDVGGLTCSPSCDVLLDDGISVRLVAEPDTGARLWSWSGACSGWRECTARLSSDATVFATFGPERFRVSVVVRGRGTVTSAPTGIACSGSCGAWFAPRTTIRLRARPARGWRFAGWSGACSGSAACVVSTTRDVSVVARLVRR